MIDSDPLIGSVLNSCARGCLGLQVLVLVLKRFLHDRGLHDTFSGGVGSFLLQLMVISSESGDLPPQGSGDTTHAIQA